jgi:asparagine synthetase B (glutamine-hydrolysing)
LKKDFDKTNIAALNKNFRQRLRTILEKDYEAVKEIVAAWGKEPENSFLRRFS